MQALIPSGMEMARGRWGFVAGLFVVVSVGMALGAEARTGLTEKPIVKGSFDDPGPTGDLRVAWTHEAETGMAPLQPLVVERDGGPLFLAGKEPAHGQGGTLVALEGSRGAVAWQNDVGPVVGWASGPNGDRVYVTVEEGIMALQAGTGETVWTSSLHATTPPLPADGTIYVGHAEGQLVAIQTGSGEIRWRTPIDGGQLTKRPTIADGTIYAVADDPDAGTGAVHALNTTDGGILWSSYVEDVDELHRLQMAVPANGLLYVAGYGPRTLAALDPGSGAVLWEIVERSSFSTPVSVLGCTLAVGRSAGTVVILNATDGEELGGVESWSDLSNRPTLSGQTVSFVHDSGDLAIWDVDEPIRHTFHRLEERPRAPPVPGGDGSLVQVTENRLMVLRGQPGQAASPEALGSCPDAGATARERAIGFGADTTREPEEDEGGFVEHGPGDDQPRAPPGTSRGLVNLTGTDTPPETMDSRDGQRAIPLGVAVVLVGLTLAVGVRRGRAPVRDGRTGQATGLTKIRSRNSS